MNDPFAPIAQKLLQAEAQTPSEQIATIAARLSRDEAVLLAALAAASFERLRDKDGESASAEDPQSSVVQSFASVANHVAHDFNNVLTAIRAQSALIRRKSPENAQKRIVFHD